jgi:MarR family 2-MHQ and catechol resistance regulon transcriptional repressor
MESVSGKTVTKMHSVEIRTLSSAIRIPVDIKITQCRNAFTIYNESMKKGEQPSEKTDGAYVFLIVWKTYRALLAKADESKKELRLGDSDFRVLEALLHKGPSPVNIIGQRVDLTTGSITTAVDRLEERWLVVRKSHPADQRVRLVELTPKGRRLIEKAYVLHEQHMEEAVASLSREERGVLVVLLKRLGKGSAT